MKKLILPLVAVLFLLPQYSISQNSADSSILSIVTKAKNTVDNGIYGTIETLNSFELFTEDKEAGLKVQASFKQTEKFDVEIYNADGITIFEETFETDDLNLAMGFSNLPAGEYFVSIVTKEGKLVKPLK